MVIDRTGKLAVARLVEKANREIAWEFPELLLEAVPYKIHAILTDKDMEFAERPRDRHGVTFRKG